MKPKTLIVKIKEPGKPQEEFEVKRKKGWSKKDIAKFVGGMRSVHLNAAITTSTIS